MTEQQLAAIDARLKAASPGPWYVTQSTASGAIKVVSGKPGATVIVRAWGPNTSREEDILNAALIANAPSDLAALLAHIRECHVWMGRMSDDRNYESAAKDEGRALGMALAAEWLRESFPRIAGEFPKISVPPLMPHDRLRLRHGKFLAALRKVLSMSTDDHSDFGDIETAIIEALEE